MNIMQMRRGMGASGSPLPYDAIEYLESSGGQYIRTGWISANMPSLKFHIVCSAVPQISGGGLFGAGSGFNVSVQNNQYRATGQVITDITPNIDRFDDITLTLEPASNWINLEINGQNFSGTYQNWSFYNELLVFRANGLGGTTRVRIKEHSLIVNNVTLYSYIPVRVSTTGYMYDKVSGQLLGNAGTGAFILGPDVQ